MPKICYVHKNFSSETMKLIVQANEIINEYLTKGYRLSLRQAYYQFVARALIPNTMKSYKRIGSIINDARLAGLIDWNAIEDRTRETIIPTVWGSPADIIEACAGQYKIDVWADQPNRVEIWVEKEALAGIVGSICQELQLPYLSCRGYTSQSEMWSSARRLCKLEQFGNKQHTVVLHLGDHDPSGIDMTRDITDRLGLFGSDVELIRIALNMDQIEQYDPPPNPAKVADSRYEQYQEEHGEESWELDALEPSVLTELIRSKVLSFRDEEKWEAAVAKQDEEKKLLQEVSDHWDDVAHFVEEGF